jgi:hypothetical protein
VSKVISAVAISAVVNQERFSGKSLLEKFLHSEGDSTRLRRLSQLFQVNGVKKSILRGLLRQSFLIEPVNAEVTSTKFKTRWGIPRVDPRFATYEECVQIFNDLLEALLVIGAEEVNQKVLLDLVTHSVLPYEIPVDYRARLNDKIHNANNLKWCFGDAVVKAIELRNFLLSADKNPDADLFASILEKKVTVKTYLTDRVLTGAYKTNREKRWEVHPGSVHFAQREECYKIELKLMSQLIFFKNFPSGLKDALVPSGLLAPCDNETICPITHDHLDFAELRASIENPDWGRSNFQVGHLNPP